MLTKLTLLITWSDKARYTFAKVDRYLAEDLSETASIESERLISEANDALMIERFVNRNMRYV